MAPELLAHYREKHIGNPGRIRTVEEIESLLDLLTRVTFTNPACTLRHATAPVARPMTTPTHVLGVGIRGQDEAGVLWFRGKESIWVSLGDFNLHSYRLINQELEFPHGTKVNTRIIRQAMVQFLLNGGQRPLDRRWWQRWSGPIPDVIQRN